MQNAHNALMYSPQKPKNVTRRVDISYYTALPQAQTYESPKRVIGAPARHALKPGEVLAYERKYIELKEKMYGVLQNEQIRKKLVADRHRNEAGMRYTRDELDDKKLLETIYYYRAYSISLNGQRTSRIREQLADGVRAKELMLYQKRKEALSVKLMQEKQRREKERYTQMQREKVQSIRTTRMDEVQYAERRRNYAAQSLQDERERQREQEQAQIAQLARERQDFEYRICALEGK